MTANLTAEDIIRQYHLKLTKPRIQVLHLLLSRQEILTAENIYEILIKNGSNINFSTVYRTLETFTEKKIIEKVQLPDSRKSGFVLFTMTHSHNLICLDCHKVIPIHGCPLKSFNEALAAETKFDIVGHDLTIYGYCERCKKNHHK
jgi:Fur family ferric uptake transcriptional regulator